MNRGKLLYRQESLEGGWGIILVLDGAVVIGRIAREPKNARYRFFPGHENGVSFDFEHADLSALKQLIETSP